MCVISSSMFPSTPSAPPPYVTVTIQYFTGDPDAKTVFLLFLVDELV